MRLAFAASALCLGLILFVAELAPSQPVPANPPAPDTSSDAASKHAKRTACLKEAKDRKLVGADKSAFLKSCIDAP